MFDIGIVDLLTIDTRELKYMHHNFIEKIKTSISREDW
jgi:hypothetical protein